jgi:hypothetical protein
MENSISDLLNKSLQFIKSKWWIFLIIILSIKGITSTWNDFKNYIVNSELKNKGIILTEENRVYVKNNIELDSSTIDLENRVEEKDYQKTKKNIAKKIKHEKGIIIDSNDIYNDKIILSKWKNREY